MFQAAWPKISQRGGVEHESERKEMVLEKKRRCKKSSEEAGRNEINNTEKGK